MYGVRIGEFWCERHLQSNRIGQIWEGKLYMLATRVLLIRAFHTWQGSARDSGEFELHQLTEDLQILGTLSLRAPFKPTTLAACREKLDIIAERNNSSTVKHVHEILEEVWKSQVGSTKNFAIDGLGKLLRCANIRSPE